MATKHCAICEADFIWSDCVEGGRADLARKVLEAIDAHPRFSLVTKSDISAALRDLFSREGIEVENNC